MRNSCLSGVGLNGIGLYMSKEPQAGLYLPKEAADDQETQFTFQSLLVMSDNSP